MYPEQREIQLFSTTGQPRFIARDACGSFLFVWGLDLPGEKYLSSQLHELCSMLNQKGVVTFLILPQHGLVGTNEATVDLSYLADSVVTLRYFEAAGEVKQALAVVKKGSGRHEKTIREYKKESGRGIRIGPPLKAFQGVLSGVPVFLVGSEQIIEQSDGVR